MADVFGYFDAIKDVWNDDEQIKKIEEALMQISKIKDLPNDFIVTYIKEKDDGIIVIEYENAGIAEKQIQGILTSIL